MYKNRIEALQQKMKKDGLDFYLFSDADGHFSEYVGDYFKLRTFFSGFSGSNGVLLVGTTKAYLWTDGRYFIQAEKELEGSSIILMKMGEKNVPGIMEFLLSMHEKKVIGIDADYLSYQMYMKLKNELAECVEIILLKDYARACLTDMDKPELMMEKKVKPISILNEMFCDVTVSKKVETIRTNLSQKGLDAYFSGKLDANMWICNIRGNDIDYCPVAFSYVFISHKDVILFVNDNAKTPDLLEHCNKNGIRIEDYDELKNILTGGFSGYHIASPYSYLNAYIACEFEKHNISWTDSDCGVSLSQAIKSEAELKALKEIYIKDSVAVCKFLYWLSSQADNTITEYDAACKMNLLRSEIAEFKYLSFETISAYGENAAMMHYSPSVNWPVYIKEGSLFLIDSGGQYEGGTTDVTRTVGIGTCSEEMKEDYTAVVRGMLALQNAHFLYGCTGVNLDILARAPIWERNLDYKCGTGHGIGFMLNVHEGPHAIRTKSISSALDSVLQEGMIVSDEPGIYKAGKYGIRLENILYCKKVCESPDGTFMEFEPLTFVPLDSSLILKAELSVKEREWIVSYQNSVCDKLKAYLSQEEYEWLCRYVKME